MAALTIAFSALAQPGLYANFPPNVRQSFAWGITDNLALTYEDLSTMVQFIFERNYGLTTEQAKERTLQISDSGLRKIAVNSFSIDYVEVPAETFHKLGVFKSAESQHIPKNELYSPIRFQKDGKDYVRWFIHPLRQDRRFLNHIGNPPVQSGRFLGQFTESRSVVLQDTANGKFWSLKLSLPESVGPFKNKTLLAEKAEQQFKSSEIILGNKIKEGHESTGFIHEQEFMGIQSELWNEGQLVRSLSILNDGKLLLPYSAIFSRGLAFFLKALKSSEANVAREKKWLAEKPGKAAAELYHREAVIVNSNHSQNSVLLLSADGEPLSYERRDFDFEFDSQRKDKKNSPLKEILPRFNGSAQLDWSMTNGFRGNSYYSSIEAKIAHSFYKAFTDRYQTLRGKPLETGDFSKKIVYKDRHYHWDTKLLKSSQELKELAKEAGWKTLDSARSLGFQKCLNFYSEP